MSGISSATDVGTLAQVIGDASLVKQSIDALTQQSSTGFVSATFDGLGQAASTALDLTAQLGLNTTAQANADQASAIQQVSQTALGQIQTIVAGFTPQLISAQTTGTQALATLSVSAQDALSQVASLLDTKVGDIYVFAGQDSRTPPVPDPGGITQSAFYAAIQSAVAALGGSGAAGVQTQTLAASGPGATSPFSASLEGSNAPASVDLGGGQRVQVGVLADSNSDAVSAGIGTTSTGSYTRDILRGLATIAALSPAQGSDPQLGALLQGTLQSLQDATGALNTDIGALGTRQARVTSTKTELSDTATALTTQLDGLQQVDLASVSTQLADAQTQLQSSYHVIASLEQLSLAKFLT
jgi:flagellar hook-associated protein 3 FlgL